MGGGETVKQMIKQCMIKECRSGDKCREKDCKNCGWNPKEAERRNRILSAHGLTVCQDGCARLMIGRR